MTKKENLHTITPEGSLGVLAYGDLAFRMWREVKKEHKKEGINEEE